VGALRDEDKPGLLDEQKSLKDAQAKWGGTTAVLTLIGAAMGGAVFPPALLALPLSAGAISVTVLRLKQNSVERLLADPPRADYETETRAHRRRFLAGAVGEDPLAIATDHAAIATLRATAYFEAAVRADERSQGAQMDGRGALAEWQLHLARELFRQGKRWSGEMAISLDTLAVTFAAFAVESRLDEAPLPDGIPETELPREVLSRSGFALNRLDLTIGRPEETRIAIGEGRATVGEVALESAIATRELARSAVVVAAGERALPRGTTRELESPFVPGERQLSKVTRFDPEDRERLLPAAEKGSVDAMFQLGALAHEGGDREEARRWLGRAAELSALREPRGYLREIQKWDEAQQPTQGELESPGEEQED